ncbi:MAG: MBL fold metallo-hydrolase [Deltaproteobacteria bacterium]|nr:MBL fold metallo-hydrolase [Deltaproteobacteria bacterium]
MPTVQVDQFLIGDHRNFIYLITSGKESLVVDPQSDLEPWQARAKELGSRLAGVLLTHTHWDHVAGVPAIVDQYAAEKLPIYVNKLDARRFDSAARDVRDRLVFVDDGQRIPLGGAHVEVLHTPGHSAGECCFLVAGSPPRLFTGDTVFVGDVGRTDLESGSTAEMFDTIQRLKKLPADTIIYPGHDYGRTPTSTIARESAGSAAFRCATVKELDALP